VASRWLYSSEMASSLLLTRASFICLFSSAQTGQSGAVQASRSASAPLLQAPAAGADEPLLLRDSGSGRGSPWLRCRWWWWCRRRWWWTLGLPWGQVGAGEGTSTSLPSVLDWINLCT
jgi:hypothetical protein